MTQDGPGSPPPTRWQTTIVGPQWDSYHQRFNDLVASGSDLAGEARLLDAMLPRQADVLDAGCGTGRVANALHRMEHRVVGVDRDEGLVTAAREWYPQTTYIVSDLLALTPEVLRKAGAPERFDLIALPGNVLVYVAPATERSVLATLLGLLKPRGRIVAGFATDREYTVHHLDRDAADLGLSTEHRFSTWDLEPWAPGAEWAVTVLRAGS